MAGYTGTKAQSGSKTQFYISTSSSAGTAGTPIFEVTQFTQSEKTNKTADVTNLNSLGAGSSGTGPSVDEFIVTTMTPGKYELTYNRVSSDPGQTMLTTAFNTGVKYYFAAELQLAYGQSSVGDLYTFAAVVVELEDLSTVNETKQIESKAGLKVSGPIAFVAGS